MRHSKHRYATRTRWWYQRRKTKHWNQTVRTHTNVPQTIKRKTVLTTKSNVINFVIIIITLHICWLFLSLQHSDTHFCYCCYLHNLYIKRTYLIQQFIWYVIHLDKLYFWLNLFYSIRTLMYKKNEFFVIVRVSLCTSIAHLRTSWSDVRLYNGMV